MTSIQISFSSSSRTIGRRWEPKKFFSLKIQRAEKKKNRSKEIDRNFGKQCNHHSHLPRIMVKIGIIKRKMLCPISRILAKIIPNILYLTKEYNWLGNIFGRYNSYWNFLSLKMIFWWITQKYIFSIPLQLQLQFLDNTIATRI